MAKPIEKVKRIFTELEKTQPITLGRLAQNAGIGYTTAKDYIEMIQFIQQAPRIEKLETGTTTLIRVQEE
ncbi:MAG: hypothetical protein ACE5I5_05880 [Candidatus Heimdallarchaeota archaeon]